MSCKCTSFFYSSSVHESVLSAQHGLDSCCHIVRVSGRHGDGSFWVETVQELKSCFVEMVKQGLSIGRGVMTDIKVQSGNVLQK